MKNSSPLILWKNSLCFIRTKHGTFYHKRKFFYNFQTTFHLYFEKRLYLTFVYSNCVLISLSYPKLKRSAMQIVFAANSLCFEHTWGTCVPNVLRYSKLNGTRNVMMSNHISNSIIYNSTHKSKRKFDFKILSNKKILIIFIFIQSLKKCSMIGLTTLYSSTLKRGRRNFLLITFHYS